MSTRPTMLAALATLALVAMQTVTAQAVPPGRPLKTGQTMCWNDAGVEITNQSLI